MTDRFMWEGEHAFIDLETLDNVPSAAIIAIGVVVVDWRGVELVCGKTLVDHEDAKRFGTVSQSTLTWWEHQNEGARHEAFNGQPRYSLGVALTGLAELIRSRCNNIVGVWGNGAAFDNAILHNAARAVGMSELWPFWLDRDIRTVVDLGKMHNSYNKQTMVFDGTPHDCLDDARHQARYTMATIHDIVGVPF